jgi:hypothetical protein
MEIVEIVSVAGVTLGTLGGFELIKWLFTRKTSKRIEQATAESSETQAERDEFYLLRERLKLADEQLLAKEQRFYDQTAELRRVTAELIDAERKIGTLSSEISELKAERKMKLCERRNCVNREPQSGY